MTWPADPPRAGAATGVAPGRMAAGFTLVELLVVLTIMSLLLGLAPLATAGVSGVRFRAGVRDLITQLRDVRAAARGSGQELTVSIDPATRSWRASPGGQDHLLPVGIETITIDGAGQPGERRIRFEPDGSASPVTLRVRGLGRSSVIRVELASGEVALDD